MWQPNGRRNEGMNRLNKKINCMCVYAHRSHGSGPLQSVTGKYIIAAHPRTQRHVHKLPLLSLQHSFASNVGRKLALPIVLLRLMRNPCQVRHIDILCCSSGCRNHYSALHAYVFYIMFQREILTVHFFYSR